MSFIRPEAYDTLRRWREALLGTLVCGLGAYWILGFSGLMPYIGGAVLIVGGVLILIGFQRARFRQSGQGPGILRVTEEQISYFGPLTGGTVALDDLMTLSIDASAKPTHWILAQPMQPNLYIPVTADGAEALFDVFVRLPGLKTERMLKQLESETKEPVLIWQRRPELTQEVH